MNARHVVGIVMRSAAFGCMLSAATTAMGEAAPAALPASLIEKASALIDADGAHLTTLFKDLHRHPEIAFTETRTAAIVSKQLKSL